MRNRLLIIALIACAVAASAGAEELVTVATRDRVSQSFLLSAPTGETPRAVALLLPGGDGAIRLRSEGGRIRFGDGNFLVHTRGLYVERGIVTAVLDAPSDQASGMSDNFREGGRHAADIARVSEELQRRFPGIPQFVIGTSRGTISAAELGASIGERFKGVVLTSTLFMASRAGWGLSQFDYTKIKIPVLLVHHAADTCFVTPYPEARKLAAARNYPLITVNGGGPLQGDPCEPLSPHGFLGREVQTVDAIVNWMLAKPYPVNIVE